MEAKIPVKKTIVNGADGIVEQSKPVFLFTMGAIYVGYIIILLGVTLIAPQQLKLLSIMVHILICFFLIYKFNPFKQTVAIDSRDSTLIFSTAVFLLLNLGITEFSINFLSNLKGVYKIDQIASMNV